MYHVRVIGLCELLWVVINLFGDLLRVWKFNAVIVSMPGSFAVES